MIYLVTKYDDIEAIYEGPDGDFSIAAWEFSLGVPFEKDYCARNADPDDPSRMGVWNRWRDLRRAVFTDLGMDSTEKLDRAYRQWLVDDCGLVLKQWKLL